ncbi:MAG: hypothetical protein ACREP8_11915, partial [Candidatus Binatia bacterium]
LRISDLLDAASCGEWTRSDSTEKQFVRFLLPRPACPLAPLFYLNSGTAQVPNRFDGSSPPSLNKTNVFSRIAPLG